MTAGEIARELWWTNHEFSPVDSIPPWISILIFHRKDEHWSALVAAVQRRSLTPSTWISPLNTVLFCFSRRKKYTDFANYTDECEISSSHGGEYEVQNCLLGCTEMSHPLWWRQHVPLKRRSTIILHGSTSQKTILNFILTNIACKRKLRKPGFRNRQGIRCDLEQAANTTMYTRSTSVCLHRCRGNGRYNSRLVLRPTRKRNGYQCYWKVWETPSRNKWGSASAAECHLT
jgi:hypothetical protein